MPDEVDADVASLSAALDAIEGGNSPGGSPPPASSGNPAVPADPFRSAPAASGDNPEAASGSGTPAEDARSPYIPRQRFDEVNNRKTELEQQVGKYSPYSPVIEAFQAMGATPEMLQQQLQEWQLRQAGGFTPPAQPAAAPAAPAQFQQAQPAADPEQAFLDFVTSQGINPWQQQLTDAEWVALRGQHSLTQQVQQLQAAHQESQQNAALSNLRSELQAVQSQHPVFKDPVFQQSLIANWRSTGQPMAQIAQQMTAAMETHQRNALAQSALQAQTEQVRPLTAGGTPPPISEGDMSWVTKGSDQEFDKNLLAELRAYNAAGRR